MTYQGARVLDYRLVELKTGVNKLEIPMTASLAPNFELAVAVMTDPRPDKVGRPSRVRRSERASVHSMAREDRPTKIAQR